MKKIICVILFCLMPSIVLSQEVVMEPEDIEIRFVTAPESSWLSGGDLIQTYFTVNSITYSAEPMSTEITHTTKLNIPETWEVKLWGHAADPHKKAVFVITIHEILSRTFELRVRNRYIGDGPNELWSELTLDKVIGRPRKPSHLK